MLTVLAEAEATTALPFPPAVFGIAALVAFALLLGVTYAFKSVGTRHGGGSTGHGH